MAMSINDLISQTKTNISEPNVERPTLNQQHETPPGNDSVAADGTTLSLSPATSVATLTKLAMNGDDARIGKVDQLRNDIATGAYNLDPAAIADALMAEWR
jgi:flagellar biosynthesis anti-sigma factor FlgM